MLVRLVQVKPAARGMSVVAGPGGPCGDAGKSHAKELGSAVVAGNVGRRVEAIELSSVFISLAPLLYSAHSNF